MQMERGPGQARHPDSYGASVMLAIKHGADRPNCHHAEGLNGFGECVFLLPRSHMFFSIVAVDLRLSAPGIGHRAGERVIPLNLAVTIVSICL